MSKRLSNSLQTGRSDIILLVGTAPGITFRVVD